MAGVVVNAQFNYANAPLYITCSCNGDGRQFRLLWFTCRREYCKFRERRSLREPSEDEKRGRQREPGCADYWQNLVTVEESTGAFLTAIATLIEDALEITLQLYIIVGHGVQENVIGQFTNS